MLTSSKLTLYRGANKMDPLIKLIPSVLEIEARNQRFDVVSMREKYIKCISALLTQGCSIEELKEVIDEVAKAKGK